MLWLMHDKKKYINDEIIWKFGLFLFLSYGLIFFFFNWIL